MSAKAEVPDVLGTAEAAELLGVEVQRISRWREGGRMPKPAADLAATPVWHRRNVEELSDGLPFTDLGTLPLVGTAEAADEIGKVRGRKLDKSQVGRWRRAGRFPEPCVELTAGPLWWRRTVRAFARTVGKPRAAA